MKNFIIKCFVPSILIEFPSYLNEETSLEIRPIKYIVKIYPQGDGTITTIGRKMEFNCFRQCFPVETSFQKNFSKNYFKNLLRYLDKKNSNDPLKY